jgi:hypothetical protein
MCSIQKFVEHNDFGKIWGDVHLHVSAKDIRVYNEDRSSGLNVNVELNLQNVNNYVDYERIERKRLNMMDEQLRCMDRFLKRVKCRLLRSLKTSGIRWKLVLYRQNADLLMWPTDDVEIPPLSETDATVYDWCSKMDAVMPEYFFDEKQVFYGDGKNVIDAEESHGDIDIEDIDSNNNEETDSDEDVTDSDSSSDDNEDAESRVSLPNTAYSSDDDRNQLKITRFFNSSSN